MSFRLATYNGSLVDPAVAMVTAFSLGNPGVHTEVWMDGYRVSTTNPGKGMDLVPENCRFRVSTFQIDKCVSIMPLSDSLDQSEWHVIHVPITDCKQAIRFIKEAMASPAEYRFSIPEFAMPKCLLDTLDNDLDCCHPEKWNTLFCSQFALLFLRRCAIAGILDIPKTKQRLLWSVNSKGCLPSRLRIITDHVFGTLGKH
jgi:hypothetical protein